VIILLSSEIAEIIRKKEIKQKKSSQDLKWKVDRIYLKNLRLDLQEAKIILPQSFFLID
jgi:hypothetical protein